MLLKDAFSDRKNLVRGLCDASLIAANISQLRAVLDSDPDNKFYIPLLTLIGFSLLLHIVFGIIIIQMWRVKRKSESQHWEAMGRAAKQAASQAATQTQAAAKAAIQAATQAASQAATQAATQAAAQAAKTQSNENLIQNIEGSLETIVHDRIPCINKTCTHCRRYETCDDLSILVVFFLVVFNVAISGIGLPTISQNC